MNQMLYRIIAGVAVAYLANRLLDVYVENSIVANIVRVVLFLLIVAWLLDAMLQSLPNAVAGL